MRQGGLSGKQNELRLENWKRDGADETLPIESFFHLAGDREGLADARLDQTRYFNETGVWVPIIALSMPDRPDGRARFACNAGDQAIAERERTPANEYIESGRWIQRFDPGTGQQEWTLSLKLTFGGFGSAGVATGTGDEGAVHVPHNGVDVGQRGASIGAATHVA